MTQVKETTDVRQAWALGALVVALISFFAFIVLPYVDPGRRAEHAPDFVLPVIHGGEPGNRLKLSDLAGTVVVLDFWASWCAPCREQMPILDRVSKEFADQKVMFVGVNTDSQVAPALEFLRKQPVSYVSVFDETGQVSRAFGVSNLPTLVVIDAEGRITHNEARLIGERSVRELVQAAR